MEAVGYDLYCKLLNEAVLALKGETEEGAEFETTVDCDIDAYIPASYIKNEYQKLDIYKRISGIESEEEYMDMQDELIDRFGEIPGPVENLLRVAALKALAHRAGVTDVFINRQEVRLVMFKKAEIDVTGIPELIGKYRGDLKLRPGDAPEFLYQDQRSRNKDCMKMTEKAKELLTELCSLCERAREGAKR